MTDISPEEAPQTQDIEVSFQALTNSLEQMTQLYGMAIKDLIVHRTVAAELHLRCQSLEAQLAALKEAATPGTVVHLDTRHVEA